MLKRPAVTMSIRWADVTDEEEEQKQNLIFVTVRIGGKNAQVTMERNSTMP